MTGLQFYIRFGQPEDEMTGGIGSGTSIIPVVNPCVGEWLFGLLVNDVALYAMAGLLQFRMLQHEGIAYTHRCY